jgi:glycosyltransferase involved in cell wall biosynthesis
MQLQNRHVLIVLGTFRMGGAERQAIHLAKWLKENTAAQITFLAFHGPGPVTDELDKLRIPYEQVSYSYFLIDNFKRFSFNLTSFSYWRKLNQEADSFAKILKSKQADIIIPFTYYPNMACALSWKKARAKICFWNQRDLGTEGFTGNYPEKKAAQKNPVYVSNSIDGIALLEKRFQLNEGSVQLIRNGIALPDRADYAGNRKAFGIPEDHKVVLMLGNFHINKDHDTLIRAWAKLIEKSGVDKPVLVLAGRFAGNEVKLKTQAASLQIADHVLFLDSVKEVNALLACADIAVHSSRTEGSPNAVLEAMAMELPVIATDIPACRDALGDSQDIFAPIANADRLSELLFRLLNDSNLCKELGKRNRQRIETKFSIQKMGKSYLDMILKNDNH